MKTGNLESSSKKVQNVELIFQNKYSGWSKYPAKSKPRQIESQIVDSRPIAAKRTSVRTTESDNGGLQKVILVVSFLVFFLVSVIFLTFVKRIEKEEEEDIYGTEQKNPDEKIIMHFE